MLKVKSWWCEQGRIPEAKDWELRVDCEIVVFQMAYEEREPFFQRFGQSRAYLFYFPKNEPAFVISGPARIPQRGLK